MMRITKKQITLVHVAKSKVGMTDDEYRDLLSSVGAKSSKDLKRAQFDSVMTHFYKLGFKKTGKAFTQRSKDALMSKIGAQLSGMGLSWNYANGIARKQSGVSHVRFCTAGQLRKVVAALAYHQKRRAKAGA